MRKFAAILALLAVFHNDALAVDNVRAVPADSLYPTIGNSKNGVAIGSSQNDVSALLDLVSTTKGLGVPSMTTTQKNAIGTPRQGLVVYDSTLKLLNLYNGTAWVSAGGGGILYAADTGTANTYAIAPTPASTAYTAGDAYTFKVLNANTGASTLNVSTLGAKNILTPQLASLPSGAMQAGAIALVVYDGTQFQLVSHVMTGPGLYQGGINLVGNNSWEADTTGWTASGGTFARTTTAGQFVPPGVAGAHWDSNGAGQTLCYTAYTITANDGLSGASGSGAIKARCASGTCTHLVYATDGSNILGSATITSSTSTFVTTPFSFLFPASGTVQYCLKSVAADEPDLFLDDALLARADNYNLEQVSQASLYGAATWPATASCTWNTTTASATPGNFSATAACTLPSGSGLSGAASAPGTKIPGITFTSLPPGDYQFVITGQFRDLTADSNGCYWRISDGTNSSAIHWNFQSAAGSHFLTLTGRINETTAQSNVTIQVQGSSDNAANTCSLDATLLPLTINVYRFPTSAQSGVTMNATPASWSGYHDNTCSWARTNAAYGDPTTDASCALVERKNRNFGTVSTSGGVLPKITFTPPRIGRWHVCAYPKVLNGTNSATIDLRLWDGTTVIAEAQRQEATAADIHTVPLCGIYDVASVAAVTLAVQTAATAGSVTIAANSSNSSALEWEIYELDAAMPTPYLVNGVVSTYAGVTTINTLVSKSANYTATTSDETIVFTASGTLSLAAAATLSGKKYIVVASGVGTNVTIDPNASETVCGSTTTVVSGTNPITIQSDGTNWQDISGYCSDVVMRATLTTAQAGVTDKVIPFNNISKDTHSGMSGGTYTNKVAGSYFIHCHATLSSSGSPNDDNLSIRVNTSTVDNDYCSLLTSGVGTSCNVTDIAQLAVGDTVDCFIDGDASFTIDNNGTRTTFALYRIGP